MYQITVNKDTVTFTGTGDFHPSEQVPRAEAALEDVVGSGYRLRPWDAFVERDGEEYVYTVPFVRERT